MEEYKDLIDLALKLNDKEWFNHLTEQAKQYGKIQLMNDTEPNVMSKQNIVLEEFNNNAVVIQTDEGLKTPTSNEELEKYNFVKKK